MAYRCTGRLPRFALLLAVALSVAGCLGPSSDESPAPASEEPDLKEDPTSPGKSTGNNTSQPPERHDDSPMNETDRPTDASKTLPDRVAGRPVAVVALIDSGINPYHEAFRDDSPLATVHPSAYLSSYPEDAVSLNLTLDASDLEEALEADEAVWANVEPGQLYWIPGTKIDAAYSFEEDAEPPVFSTGHGTMTASRAAANQYSLCSECRIAAVQGASGDAVSWVAGKPWVDAQSNSWSPIVPFEEADPVQSRGLSEAFEAAANQQLVFASAGNGAGGKGGVAGHPSFTRSTSGPPGVVSTGGHDNGQVALWPGSTPQVVADACDNMAAVGDQIDGYDTVGGGTSSASPYAAGAAAKLVLESRRLLDDPHETGVENGTLARGDGTGPDGVLSDGELTLEEAKRVLFHTSDPGPPETENAGEVCTTAVPHNTYPVRWDQIPEDAPRYYFIGFGAVTDETVEQGIKVLAGLEELPAREQARRMHEQVTMMRETYHGTT